MDVLLSAAGLLVLSPLLLGIAFAIKLGSPGPVFYRGRRVGRHNRPFRMFKFRSMVVNAEQLGGSSTGDDDPRITSIGLFMRKYKLDELPQLINVLCGDMSLVGPRPEVQQYVDMYTDREKVILEVRPGVTDWASIWNSDEGAVLAGAEDPDQAYEELIRPTKLKLQRLYVSQQSLWTDLKILFYTGYKLVNKGFVPGEIEQVLRAEPAAGTSAAEAEAPQFGTVTELPGHGATREQLSMIHTRYRLAAELAAGKDVLELACGPGVGLGYLSRTARRVVGADCDPSLVEQARQHYGSRLEVRRLDAQDLPYPDASFDVILLLEAIYYLPDPSKFIREAQRVLRPDGAVLICSANCERRDFNPSPFAHKYYSAAELQQLLCGAGFDVQLYGGYAVETAGWKRRLLGALRQAAVRLRLIPRTMAWKIRLKRLLFGRLDAIPSELQVDETQCQQVIPIDPSGRVEQYKVVYAVGRRAA